jgi:hypothetical protein
MYKYAMGEERQTEQEAEREILKPLTRLYISILLIS